eukprot:XP_019922206.1 PREDICTED: spore coat protein SP85-like [Crassostrea gigas]
MTVKTQRVTGENGGFSYGQGFLEPVVIAHSKASGKPEHPRHQPLDYPPNSPSEYLANSPPEYPANSPPEYPANSPPEYPSRSPPVYNYEGKTYNVGQKFPAGDDCNTCTCKSGGRVSCSKKTWCKYLHIVLNVTMV